MFCPNWHKWILIKISVDFWVEIHKLTNMYIWKNVKRQKGTQISLKKNKAGRLVLPDFKTWYKATVIKVV